MKKMLAAFCGPACLALLLLSSASQADFTFSSIARPGDPAPVPRELRQVGSPSVNDGGQVAFEADNAVFLQSDGATTIVAAFGDPAPGGGTFLAARMPSVNAQGQVAFAGEVTPPGRSGIFLWSEGSVQPIAQSGDAAPDGGIFLVFFELSIQAAGEAVEVPFSAYTSLNHEGLFLFSQGAVQLLAGGADPAPGGGAFAGFYFPVVNVHGQVAFYSTLSPTGSGIFLCQPDRTIAAVARAGDSAPAGGTFDFPIALSLNQHLAATGDGVQSRGLRERSPRVNPPLDRQGSARQGPSDGDASFSYFGFPPASINDRGEVVFSAGTSIFGRGGIFVFFEGQITRRIRETDPAPGGGVLGYMDSTSINAAGQIAFRAYVSPGPGVFLFSPDRGVILVARRQQPSPEGDIFTSLSAPSLNAAGQVAFAGQLSTSMGGVYLFSQGKITRVAGQGDPIDREPKFIDPLPQAINGAGTVVFYSRLFPGGYGLFVGAPSAVIAGVGDPAPGGGVFNYISALPGMNDSGQAVFAGNTTRDVSGVYSSSDGVLSRIVGTGDPLPDGGTFFYVSSPSINNNGDLAFLGYASFLSRSGLFVLAGGQFRLLVAFGDPAPGGGTFQSLGFSSLNNAGELAFPALVAAPGRTGIFLWSRGAIRAIAQTGDPAPESTDTFNFPGYLSSFFRPSLNASGQVAFAVPLSRGSTGVFLSTGDALTPVAQPGDPAPGGGTITFADSASLNDAGQVAFPAGTFRGIVACLASEGTITKIVEGGDPAPGGGTFGSVDFPKLNSRTQAAFLGRVSAGNGAFLATPAGAP